MRISDQKQFLARGDNRRDTNHLEVPLQLRLKRPVQGIIRAAQNAFFPPRNFEMSLFRQRTVDL